MKAEALIGKHYKIGSRETDRIGRGGMGDVYRAIDTRTQEPVAIKHLKAEVLALDENTVERFEREGEALRRLNHPNIVKVLASVEELGDHYIVMEYVAGGSLSERLAQPEPMPVNDVLKIALELADALTRAHHLNIIHRDIKPANVLIAEDGTPRLTDFGVAHIGDLARITQTGMLTGTYAYVSPEACDGSMLDGRTDIWSFGVVLYEMLAGRRPFDENNLTATITAILSKPVPDLTQFRHDVPESLTNLIYRMLEKDRRKRIGSVRLVGAQLEAIMSGLDTGAIEIEGSRFDTTASTLTPPIGPRHNLPPQPTSFVGRELEVLEMVNLLSEADCRLLTLMGPGGMGKTRLAMEVASRKVDDFKHGVRFVGLAAVSEVELMVTAVAQALNFSFPERHNHKEQLLTYLREKEMLLIMDNFEHLIEGVDLVSDILAAAPHVKVLATSRESLNLWEEWLRPVRGMRYPENGSLDEIDPYSAIKLFADRARRVRADFSLEDELPNVVRICQLVEGMPLGIELAATWLKVLSSQQIVAEIEKSFDFLSTSMRNIAERHRSMRAVFDYSWQLLTEPEKRAFRRLSIFRGGFNRQAAEKIAGATLLTLTSLVNKSLLYEGGTAVTDKTTTTTGSKYRYTMHELLKQYALDKLAEDEAETVVTQGKHALYCAQLLQQQESNLMCRQQKMALDIISTDVDNIRAAWRWLAANMTPQPEMLEGMLQATESLYLYYENRGQISEGMEMLDLALTAVDALPASFLQRRTLAKLLSRQAILAFRANQFTLCSDLFHRSDPLLRELLAEDDLATATKNDIEHDIAFSSVYYSYVVARTQTLDATKELLREAIAMCEANGNQWVLARALNALGNTERIFDEKKRLYLESIRITRELGDEIYLALAAVNLINWVSLPHEVRPLLEEVIEIYQRMESQSGMALGYNLLSNSAFRAGDYLQAKSYSQKSLAIYKELGFMYYYIPNIQNLANTCWALGDLDEAEEHMQHALRLVKESGDLENTIKTSNVLSLFYLENGELEKAREHYKMSQSLLLEIQSARQKSEALDSLGNLALDLGEYGQARKHFEAHIPAAENASDTTGAAWAKKNLGTIALELGDYETAVAYFQESLESHRQEGHSWAIMDLLDCMGRVAYALGDNVAAAAHYREALELPQNFWTILNQLEIVVDWSGLLMKMGERERPFICLTVLSRHPMFVPPVIHRRVRQKAARLLAELEVSLSKQTVAQIKLNTRGQSIEDVVNGLLDPEISALEMMTT